MLQICFPVCFEHIRIIFLCYQQCFFGVLVVFCVLKIDSSLIQPQFLLLLLLPDYPHFLSLPDPLTSISTTKKEQALQEMTVK